MLRHLLPLACGSFVINGQRIRCYRTENDAWLSGRDVRRAFGIPRRSRFMARMESRRGLRVIVRASLLDLVAAYAGDLHPASRDLAASPVDVPSFVLGIV